MIALPTSAARTRYAACPLCKQKNALAITLREGKQLYHCFYGCNQDLLWRVVRDERPFDYPPTSKPRQRVNLESVEVFARRLWNGSLPAQGTPTETYLHGRGLTLPIPATIRHLPNCRHTPSGKNHPAMIAAVADYASKVFAVHRTYLLPDGTGKADVTPAKMSLGNIGGHGVWLTPLADKMAVTEGIENGLAVQQAEGFALLCTMPCPLAFTPSRWRQLVDDGGDFLDQWGRQTAALGWRAVDCFGVNPDAPEARYDGMGLVPLLAGRRVCAITADTARIDCGKGAHLTFYRKTMAAAAVAIWKLEEQ